MTSWSPLLELPWPEEPLPCGVKRKTIGVSRQGRPLSAWIFSEAQATQTLPELTSLVFAAIHGDEPLSAQVTLRWLNQCLSNSSAWVSHNFAVIPVLNPDGFCLNTRKNAWQVDLNRNFPTHNWEASQTAEHYHGGHWPAGEPETLGLMNFINATQPKRILSVHTPYKVVNYDGPADELAAAMAKACGYGVTTDIGYATPGSFGTYCGVEQQIPVITLELPPDDADLNTVYNTVKPAYDLFING